MESRGGSKKQQILDKFTAYVEGNLNASYDDVAEAMQRSPKTIYRWCKKLGIRLPTLKADDRLGVTLPFTTGNRLDATLPSLSSTTKEEEDLDEQLDRIIAEGKRYEAHLQKRIDELQNQLEEIYFQEQMDELQNRFTDACRRIQGNAGHRKISDRGNRRKT